MISIVLVFIRIKTSDFKSNFFKVQIEYKTKIKHNLYNSDKNILFNEIFIDPVLHGPKKEDGKCVGVG